MRKFKNWIRCVKNWDGEDYGFWAWSEFWQSWQIIAESRIQWILDFLPDPPTVADIKAEAFSDMVIDRDTGKMVFTDRIFETLFEAPIFTEEELKENARFT